MKKHLLFVILALVVTATPLLAAEGTIAAYFPATNGVDFSRYAQYSSFFYDAYITIHVEDVVRGGSFKLAFDSAEVSYLSEVYPASVYVGDILGGVDLGLSDPIFGFLGAPCVVCTVTFVNNVYPNVPNVNFEILPAFANETPIYADGEAVLHPLTGQPSALGDTVDNDDATWGTVKALYR